MVAESIFLYAFSVHEPHREDVSAEGFPSPLLRALQDRVEQLAQSWCQAAETVAALRKCHTQ